MSTSLFPSGPFGRARAPHPNSRIVGLAVLAGLLLVSASATLLAHRVGESYLFLSVFDDRMEGRWEATLQELGQALSLDRDGDGAITPGEVEARVPDVQRYLLDRVALSAGGRPLALDLGGHVIMDIDLGRFFVQEFTIQTSRPPAVDLEYRAFFDVRPEHRAYVLIEYDALTGEQNTDESVSLVVTRDTTSQSLDLTPRPTFERFGMFVGEGIRHIWIGIDHVLFLVALVLPAVMTRRAGRWEAVEGFRPALFRMLTVVTLFTLAHSITLSLAALGWLDLPSRLIESVIAASVVVAAINGGFVGRRIWAVIFAFGLFHGMGFATVLGHLTMDRRHLLPTLIGFNVGVEIGQVAILGVVFPALFVLRNTNVYRPVILKGGSAIIALLALVWLVERALDVTVLGL